MVQWELNVDRLQNLWSIIYRLCGCFSYFSKQSLLHDYKQIYICFLVYVCVCVHSSEGNNLASFRSFWVILLVIF